MCESNLFDDVTSALRRFVCKLHGVMDDHNYSPTLHVLFDKQKNEPVVSDQEIVNLLWSMLEELQNILEYSNVFPKRVKVWMDETRPTSDKCLQTDPSMMTDDKLIQITCDNNEFKRRIDAFIKRKRIESDTFNRREFCKIHSDPTTISCARTDAVFVQRRSQKSLLKIKRVHNLSGDRKNEPIKLDEVKNWPPLHPSTLLPFHKLPHDLKERVGNIQAILFENRPLNQFANVYEVVRALESRVLYLESLSPEYFQKSIGVTSRGPVVNTDFRREGEMNQREEGESGNLALLEERIAQLQEKLRQKSKNLNKD
ncbi:MAP3K12-binding inhibitory protein 1-like [Hydractinia symbiolongicarpus]|uniref:MAP3K12-binding inhibitory protein 1-like n=1 Tax=Hydractinia symbiolongicarpus TaxID=13093 RepID=UPI00254AF8F3|nr:MAP3K12-binding inhibitory protein 1-like [Hydractinia symbiolongicarpus]